jgi:D-sedoheptulose 7-phosphate isomerase
MNMKEIIYNQIRESIEVKERLLAREDILSTIYSASEKVIDVFRRGGKILIGGNGGSAADAQHIAGEFVSRFYFDRPGLPAIALTTDTSILTAIGNDYGYEYLFKRQIEALGRPDDVFIAISTSGNSKNIISALHECRNKGLFSIGLTGSSNCAMDDLCDLTIKIPSTETPRIQESHILVAHIICCIAEEVIFSNYKNI